ncbi:hypothetical protein PSTT_16025, partial [Puccinia striiformis]
ISKSSKKRKTSAQKEAHTLDFKLEVIKWHKDNKSTQLKTAQKFGINQTSLSRWLKDKAMMQNRVTYNGGTLEAMHLARADWQSVTQSTIANCWRHIVILQSPNNMVINNIQLAT